MPDVKWTAAQRRAIEERGNILVSAAAGSGKTATLSARIMHLLTSAEEEATLGQFLIVTFTNAAAAELRARIAREVAEAGRRDPKLTRRIGGSVETADICTIHSFCLKIIRENFSLLGLPPDVRIADEAEAEVLLSRAMEETVDDLFGGSLTPNDPASCDAAALADTLGRTKDAAGLDGNLKWIYDRLRAIGEDTSYLTSEAERLETASANDFFESVWGAELRRRTAEAAYHALRVISELSREMAETDATREKYCPAAEGLEGYLRRIVRCAESGTYSAMREAVMSYEPIPLGRLAAKDQTEASQRFKSERDRVKRDMAALANRYYAATAEDASESQRCLASVLRCAAGVIDAFDRRYTELKRERSLLDFSDLELLALRLLEGADGSPSAAATAVGSRYRYIFIDEYQDTNSVQDRIFRAVGGTSERFFVGDIKQSIYRFRGAEPEVFSGYRRAWPENADDSDASPHGGYPSGHSIFMSENFRCAAPIIDFVNTVSRYMFPHGGIPFGEEDCLRYGGVTDGDRPVEVCILERPRRRAGEDETPEDGAMTEAQYTARRILRMVRDEGVLPSEIAILLRSANTHGDEYERELSLLGIPVRRAGGSSFAESPEIILLLDLLRAVDNPMHDVPLAGAMLSSVFGFTLDDLVILRRRRPDRPLFESVSGAAEEDSDELSERCRRMTARIAAARCAERGMSADRFIEYIYAEYGIFDLPEAARSPEATGHLNLIHDMARSYESGTFGGLSGFLIFIDQKLAAGGLSADFADGESGVSVMSIHKSKGLEFRVCFLCGCGQTRNRSDERGRLLFDRSLGFAMHLPDPGGLVMCGNPVRSAVASHLSVAAAEEEMRVLYVAMTRARERLIVTAKSELSADAELSRARDEADFTDRYSTISAPRMIDLILRSLVGESGVYYSVINVPPDTAAEAERLVAGTDAEQHGEVLSEEGLAKIRRALEFEYPLAYLAGIPKKLSVSTLSPNALDGTAKISDAESVAEETVRNRTGFHDIPIDMPVPPDTDICSDGEFELPRFMSGANDGAAAARGTSTHVFLQFADFNLLQSEGTESELARLLSRGFITRDMASLVNLGQIETFAHSPIMDRILDSRKVLREFRFNVALPAERFTENDELAHRLAESGERLTVQGVFDCVFEDSDGRLVLLDYKTDALSAGERRDPRAGRERLRLRHSRQLGYYADAVECLFGRRPDEVYIYSLTLGECIAV